MKKKLTEAIENLEAKILQTNSAEMADRYQFALNILNEIRG